MAATGTSSNIRARDKVMWSGRDGSGRTGQVAPASSSSATPLTPGAPHLCLEGFSGSWSWGGVAQGHLGPFHEPSCHSCQRNGSIHPWPGWAAGTNKVTWGTFEETQQGGDLWRGHGAEAEVQAGRVWRQRQGEKGKWGSPGPAPGKGWWAGSSGCADRGRLLNTSTATGWAGLPRLHWLLQVPPVGQRPNGVLCGTQAPG